MKFVSNIEIVASYGSLAAESGECSVVVGCFRVSLSLPSQDFPALIFLLGVSLRLVSVAVKSARFLSTPRFTPRGCSLSMNIRT